MRYALLAVISLATLVAQEAPVPPPPIKATISNLDKEPAPYVPDAQDVKAATIRDTDKRHAYENYVELKMAEQGAKVMFYNSAATLNNALANRAEHSNWK